MDTARKWTVLTVRIRNKRRVFRHGKSAYRFAPAVPMDYGAMVKVYRKGRLFDEGRAEEVPNPHDQGVFFTGLPKTVPREARYYVMGTFPGGAGTLRPRWYEEGDVIRLEVPHWEFRGCMRSP